MGGSLPSLDIYLRTMAEEQEPTSKKRRMPASVYVGSGLIGFAVLGFLFWCAAFLRTDAFIRQGVGNTANLLLLLTLYPVFFVGLPLFVGIRLLRGAKSDTASSDQAIDT